MRTTRLSSSTIVLVVLTKLMKLKRTQFESACHYKEHSKRLETLLREFFGYIAKEPHLKSLCDKERRLTDPTKTKKSFYCRLGGNINDTKIRLLNECLILFFLMSKRKYKLDATNLPIPFSNKFKPGVTSMRLSALFGHFYREGIRIKLGKHFKFQGGLHRVVQNHYCDVHTVRPDDYGVTD